MEKHVRHIVGPLLSPLQFGYRRGSTWTDFLFTMKQLRERTIEHDKEQFHILCVDLKMRLKK